MTVLVSSFKCWRFLREAPEEPTSCLSLDLVDLVEMDIVRGEGVLVEMDAREACTRSLCALVCFWRISGELRCRGLRLARCDFGITTGFPLDTGTLVLLGRMIWAKTRPLLVPAAAEAEACPTLGAVVEAFCCCLTAWLNGNVRGEVLGFVFNSAKSGVAVTGGEEEGCGF